VCDRGEERMARYLIVMMLLTILLAGCGWLSDDAEPTEVIPVNEPSAVAATATTTSAPPLSTSAIESPTAVVDAQMTPGATEVASTEPVAKLAYFHIAPTNGEPAGTLAEYADFITLTSGDDSYRTQLRAAGYTGTILQFLVASEVNGPGPYRDSTELCDEAFDPLRNGIARTTGEFCRDIHPNEDWFLHNSAGERLYVIVGSTGVWYHMNPASVGWRSYALGHMLRDVTGPTALGYDGIFLDNVEVSPVRAQTMMENADGSIAELPTDEMFRDAWATYLSELSEGLREHVQLWGNMVADTNDGDSWQPYLPYLDGVMSPAFATGYDGLSVGKWLNNIQQAETALANGKGVVAVGLGAREDEDMQQFALGSYLLVAEGDRTFFRYVSNEGSADFSSFWLYPNYDLVLGPPLGDRYRVGLNWRRDFQCGYVIVEPSRQMAEITQTAECS
jgi:hypothetical protein